MALPVDYKTVDLATLLSDQSVQQFLDLVDAHPDWSIARLLSHLPRPADGKAAFTYNQARAILCRLNLNTRWHRRLHVTAVNEYDKNENTPFVQHMPHLLAYIRHREEYKQQQQLQPPAVTLPIPTPLPQPKREISAPPVSYTLAQQTAFQWFDRFFLLAKGFGITFLLSLLFLVGGSFILDVLLHAQTLSERIGMFFSFSALSCGLFFFLYSLKYYLTIAVVLSFSRQGEKERKGAKGGIGRFFQSLFGISIEITTEGKEEKKKQASSISLQYDLLDTPLERQPFISLQVATYNEKRVIERFLMAATAMDYPNFEVIVADDSNDETGLLLKEWEKHPRVKISHRESREGYKGGALAKALELTDPRAEFILVFDADFIPYPDCIDQFLKYFQTMVGSLEPQALSQSQIAAVQGYQWHVLNKSENWITRGVRSEYAGSYVMERSGEEVYGGLKQISGSVYMIRTEVLKQIGWGTSLTEDFELTLRLYEKGYKVVYTPYIQAPAEAVSTIKRLIRQRMRWAEGHSFNVRKMFARLLFSPRLTPSEKLEFVYLAPYYLQAFLFLVGTFSWFTAEMIYKAPLPFWTEAWGWSLVITNLLALPLMNLVGLFMEDSEERDYLGLISFILLAYIIAPFQAFAAVKGFLEKEEGPWFRTPKTGKITDAFTPGRISRFVRGLLRRPSMAPAFQQVTRLPAYELQLPLTQIFSSFAPGAAGRQRSLFASFVPRATLVFVLIVMLLLNNSLPFSLLLSEKNAVSDDHLPLRQGLTLTPTKDSFSSQESPSFTLALEKDVQTQVQQALVLGRKHLFGRFFGVNTAVAAEDHVKAEVLYYHERVAVLPAVKKENDGLFQVTVPTMRAFKPGKYTLQTRITAGEKTYQTSQDFSWGVLAINTKKSIYEPGETLHFGFAVLDDLGETICHAKLTLRIIVPSAEQVSVLTTENGGIKPSGHCSRNNVTNQPDYTADFPSKTAEESYLLHLEAETENGSRSLDEQIQIKKNLPFEVSRQDYPMRINPKASYPARITIKARRDYQGRIAETVPETFKISHVSGNGSVQHQEKTQVISWDTKIKKGQTITLGYTIDFPKVSPQFYTIGPLTLHSHHTLIFQEARPWQIASDLANGDGLILWGQGTNTNNQKKDYTNSTNTFSAAGNTVAGATGVSFRMRTSPTKVEAIAGYVTSTGYLHILCYNGSSWSDDWNVSVWVGEGGVERHFDIAYETNSGDAMVLYGRGVATPNELGYRTKAGSNGCGSANWSGENLLDPVRTDAEIVLVTLASDRRSSSNLIAAAFADKHYKASAMIWSGSAWGNEPSTAISTNLSNKGTYMDTQAVDIDYESSSGDVLVVWGEYNNHEYYRTCTGGTSLCTWGSNTNIGFTVETPFIDISANPNTNEVIFGAISTSDRLELAYWSGSAWSTVSTDVDTTLTASASLTMLVATGWLISGATTRAIIAYDDAAATNVGYYIWDGSSFSAGSDWTPSTAFGNPQKWYDIQMDPLNTDRLMLTISDTNSDLFAKRLVMTSTPTFTWSDSDGGSIETNMSVTDWQDFAFAYYKSTGAVPENFWLLFSLSPLLWIMIRHLRKQQAHFG